MHTLLFVRCPTQVSQTERFVFFRDQHIVGLHNHVCHSSLNYLRLFQLQVFGIDDTVIDVTSENAAEFMFSQEFFSDAALESKQITVGDGATLSLSEDGTVGAREFQRFVIICSSQ